MLLAAALLATACGDDDAQEDGHIGGSMILATTTSTFDSGLLDEIVPIFQEQSGVEVKVIAVGTGAALRMAGDGDADAVLVHAPLAEQEYVNSGDLVDGVLIMHNDFVLVGPPPNPASVASDGTLAGAMVALSKAAFISRGDDSGTHKRELSLWATAGIDPADAQREETGQGMGATLNIADQKAAYTLTDRATYLALRDKLELEIVFEGDTELLNIYHAHLVSLEMHSGVHEAQARAFLDFLVAPETQSMIAKFGVAEFGQPLFVPDAGQTVDSLAQ